MVKIQTNQDIWTLNLFRLGLQGVSEDIRSTDFIYARNSCDIGNLRSNIPLMNLQSGVVSLIKKFNILEETLETGCVVEMSKKSKKKDWLKLSLIAYSDGLSNSRPHGFYISERDGMSIEFVSIYPFEDDRNHLPKCIWIRVRRLNQRELLWAVDNNLWREQKTRQTSLREWFEFPEIDNIKYIEEGKIPLPGPPRYPYSFL